MYNKIIGNTLEKVGLFFVKAGRVINNPNIIHKKHELLRWHNIDGDTNLRLNYDLHEDSIIFDLGGYKGEWTSNIYSMYNSTIFVFEPVPDFAQKLVERFQKNPKIKVHKFGLANLTKIAKISLSENASSLIRTEISKNQVQVKLVKASDFFIQNSIKKIDLMKINIEGSEYELLDHLLDNQLVCRIKNLQIQFHDFIPNAEIRMADIQQRLSYTHELTYQYTFVWENWKLKKQFEL